MNPDTCGRGDSIRIRIFVDAETFNSWKKSLRIQKYPDTCGRSLGFAQNEAGKLLVVIQQTIEFMLIAPTICLVISPLQL